jgi:hypothetical protein
MGTLLFLLACTPDQTFHIVDDAYDGDDSTITGRVCNPVTSTWVEGAQVYTHLIDDEGVLYDTARTTSDEAGWWALTGLPTDSVYTIYVQYGSEMIDIIEVDLPQFGGADIEPPSCSGGGGDIVVISGDYDEFDKVLEATGNPDYDLVNGQTGEELVDFLSDVENLNQYEKVFFTGGHLEEDIFYDTDGDGDPTVIYGVQDSIRAYVEGGGKLYVTDWSYDVIEAVWPDHIDFLGDDLVPDAAQKGEPGQIISHVNDQDMGDAVGADVAILYDLIEWPLIESVHPDVKVHIDGHAQWRDGFDLYTVPDSPMLVSFEAGGGQVVFTSFRHTAQAKGSGLPIVDYIINDL